MGRLGVEPMPIGERQSSLLDHRRSAQRLSALFCDEVPTAVPTRDVASLAILLAAMAVALTEVNPAPLLSTSTHRRRCSGDGDSMECAAMRRVREVSVSALT
jgi:hypothetical protein